MSKWIKYGEDAFNINEMRHIWVENSINGHFIMGEFVRTNEEVVLSHVFNDKDDCLDYMYEILSEKT